MRSAAHPVLLAITVLLPFVACATKTHKVTSEQQACDVLQRAALQWCLSRRNLAGRYWCDPVPGSPEYFVLGLRYHPKPEEFVGQTADGWFVGSSLIGWYAVSKADGAVFNFDIETEGRTPLVSGCPFESE